MMLSNDGRSRLLRLDIIEEKSFMKVVLGRPINSLKFLFLSAKYKCTINVKVL
jgi:hypothetical protein